MGSPRGRHENPPALYLVTQVEHHRCRRRSGPFLYPTGTFDYDALSVARVDAAARGERPRGGAGRRGQGPVVVWRRSKHLRPEHPVRPGRRTRACTEAASVSPGASAGQPASGPREPSRRDATSIKQGSDAPSSCQAVCGYRGRRAGGRARESSVRRHGDGQSRSVSGPGLACPASGPQGGEESIGGQPRCSGPNPGPKPPPTVASRRSPLARAHWPVRFDGVANGSTERISRSVGCSPFHRIWSRNGSPISRFSKDGPGRPGPEHPEPSVQRGGRRSPAQAARQHKG